MNAYLGVHAIQAEKERYPAFRIPMLLIPASIDNNLPGCELAIGTDTAINNATWAIDRIKESAAASKRCFIAETMGRRCGYLTLMSALSGGAEYMYINEESPSLQQIAADADRMVNSFKSGRRLFLTLVNESASRYYDRDFLADVFTAESEGIYDVRHQALGHMQQGGAPSPYDRLLATRLIARASISLSRSSNPATAAPTTSARSATPSRHARSSKCSTTWISSIAAPSISGGSISSRSSASCRCRTRGSRRPPSTSTIPSSNGSVPGFPGVTRPWFRERLRATASSVVRENESDRGRIDR